MASSCLSKVDSANRESSPTRTQQDSKKTGDTILHSTKSAFSASLLERINKQQHRISDEEMRLYKNGQNLPEDLIRMEIDSNSIERDVYYWLSDEPFVNGGNNNPEYLIYFRRAHGDEVKKILLEKQNGQSYRTVLASRGGDGQNTYESEVRFLNDSSFLRTLILEETVLDEQTEVRDRIITIQNTFAFNELVSNAVLVKSDTTQHFEGILTPLNKSKKRIAIYHSKPFIVNGQKCFWERTVEEFMDVSFVPVPRYKDRLIRVSDEKVILETDEEEPLRNSSKNPPAEYFKDINLDGFLDFSYYSAFNSGSGGAFFSTYIYNKSLKVFEHSSDFSGGELFVDSLKRNVTSSWRTGASHYGRTTRYLDSLGNIVYRDITTRQPMSQNKALYLLTTDRIIGTDTFRLKVDTVGKDEY